MCPGTSVCDSTTGYCVVPGGGACFVAGTRVALADGTSKPIELVDVGDLVIGQGGWVNRVLAIARPVLGERPLYALNGGSHFVTPGHPFFADGAWRAIDPSEAATEVPGLPVGRLTVGADLLSLAGVAVPVGAGVAGSDSVDVRLEPVSLRSLDGRAADPATPLYNLKVDGNHTYFANDLLVHNKYF
jgi:hypothetical protein